MFAKLKKKIEHEGGTVPESSRTGGGMSRHSSVTSLPGAGMIPRVGPSPPGSVTSEDFSVRDNSLTNRDDMIVLVQKKTEQCRKLEGNISDLAALIKDKSKTIEKLEATIKQQDDVTNQKLQDQKAEFEKYRDKLIEGYQEEKIKLDKLLNTEESLKKCQSELEQKTQKCQAAENQVEKLTDEILPLRQKLTSLEGENEKLREESKERAELVTSLTKEKSVFDTRLNETNHELTEKQGQISKLQAQLSDLEGELQTLQRNSDIHKNKTSKLLQEKEDLIDTLQERVETLDTRVSNSTLSGDDRTTALQAERDNMELRLSEARQQLTEVKSMWSDKITQLEDQISHLNAKIVEDSEELASNKEHCDHLRASYNKQIDDLKEKLEDAEKRALENLELSNQKDKIYERQIHQVEAQLRQQKQSALDLDTYLRGKASNIKTELEDVTEEREQQKARIKHLEGREATLTEQSNKLTKDVAELEEILELGQKEVVEKTKRIKTLEEQLSETTARCEEQATSITSLKEQVFNLESQCEKVEQARSEYEKHLRISEQDKGGLLERNAELHKEMEALTRTHADGKMEFQRTLDLKEQTIENIQQKESELRDRMEALEQQIELSEMSKAESGLYSDRIEEMTDRIATLQSQIGDKNRTIKKQEQMLKDLRQTLQRELKVQSLPNDDMTDHTLNNVNSPSLSRKHDTRSSENNHHSPHQNNTSSNSPQSSHPAAAVLTISTCGMTTFTSSSPSVSASRDKSHTSYSKTVSKEVNVQYLKHVVLKFMLSREAEAIQLIKAVAVLLNFSQAEQNLIKETLEWKMSWFGARPPLGRGQTSK